MNLSFNPYDAADPAVAPAGKSTLIKVLEGGLGLWRGSRKVGDGCKISYFSQDLAQDLPLEMTALEYVEMKVRDKCPVARLQTHHDAILVAVAHRRVRKTPPSRWRSAGVGEVLPRASLKICHLI